MWRHRFLNSMCRIAAYSGMRRHMAYLLVGLGVMFGLLNPVKTAALSGRVLAGSALILLLFILGLAQLVAIAQPVFKVMGNLPWWAPLSGLVVLVLARAYYLGRRWLRDCVVTPEARATCTCADC